MTVIKEPCHEVYDCVRSWTVLSGDRVIGDLVITDGFGYGAKVILCGRLGYSNACFATEEGALKYMDLVAATEKVPC